MKQGGNAALPQEGWMPLEGMIRMFWYFDGERARREIHVGPCLPEI